MNKPAGNFKPGKHKYLAKVHWQGPAVPKTVKENGTIAKQLQNAGQIDQSAGWYYDINTKLLWIKSAGDNGADLSFEIN
ncbi:hypothetical protein D3C85_1393680 [compost metagenome]